MMQSPLLAGAIVAPALLEVPTGKTVALSARGSVVEITIRVYDEHAPAFRSAVEELANEIGGRLEGMHSFAQETALTDALCAVGELKAETFKKIPAGDPHYKQRARR